MSLSSEWVSFRMQALARNLPPEVIPELRKIFAAGAISMLGAIHDWPKEVETEDDADEMMRALAEECSKLAS